MNSKKQAVILWIAAGIITFLAGYTQSTMSPLYPINGTIKLSNGEKASFSFDKIFHGKGDYPVEIVSNEKNLTGILEWRIKTDSTIWQSIHLKHNGEILSASMPHQNPLTKIEFRVKLNDINRIVLVPETENAKLQFLGFVPPEIMQFYYITLFAGIILSLRTGLEIFRDKPRIKMYTIFTLISFFSFTFVFSTVKKGCELGIIGGTKIASLQEIFPSAPVLLFTLWVITLILVFNTKKIKKWALASSIVTMIIFLAAKF